MPTKPKTAEPPKRRRTEKDRRETLGAITVPLSGPALAGYRKWKAKADQVAERWIVLREFAADWYPDARTAWVEAAVATGLWEPSADNGSCSQTGVAGSKWLDHVRDIHGRQFHLTVEDVAGKPHLVARFCYRSVSDADQARWAHIWTQDMRLSIEELRRGDRCKGCGRPMAQAGSWAGKGTMHYTEEERREADAEEAEYKRLHPDCHASRWLLSGSVVTHCSRCCPPPPMSPEQIASIAGIFASSERDRAALRTRWAALGSRPTKPPEPKRPPQPDPVEKLKRDAARLGYRLVPDDAG